MKKKDKKIIRSPDLEGRTGTILIVDDDMDNRTYLTAILSEFGYKTVAARDGEEAVSKFMKLRNDIRLIISDIMMPKKNGIDACNEMKRIRPDIKVLFMSGYCSETIKRQGIIHEGINFLSKPLDPGSFLRKVRELIEGDA